MFAVFAAAAVPVWRHFAQELDVGKREQSVPQQAHRRR